MIIVPLSTPPNLNKPDTCEKAGTGKPFPATVCSIYQIAEVDLLQRHLCMPIRLVSPRTGDDSRPRRRLARRDSSVSAAQRAISGS